MASLNNALGENMIPQLTLTGNEMIEHDEGFVTMRLHCELPNGAHYFIDEDDYHVGEGTPEERLVFVESMNKRAQQLNVEVRVCEIVAADGQTIPEVGLYSLVDVVELGPEYEMSDAERYAYEQCIDSGVELEDEVV